MNVTQPMRTPTVCGSFTLHLSPALHSLRNSALRRLCRVRRTIKYDARRHPERRSAVATIVVLSTSSGRARTIRSLGPQHRPADREGLPAVQGSTCTGRPASSGSPNTFATSILRLRRRALAPIARRPDGRGGTIRRFADAPQFISRKRSDQPPTSARVRTPLSGRPARSIADSDSGTLSGRSLRQRVPLN